MLNTFLWILLWVHSASTHQTYEFNSKNAAHLFDSIIVVVNCHCYKIYSIDSVNLFLSPFARFPISSKKSDRLLIALFTTTQKECNDTNFSNFYLLHLSGNRCGNTFDDNLYQGEKKNEFISFVILNHICVRAVYCFTFDAFAFACRFRA